MVTRLSEILTANGSDKCTDHSFYYVYDGFLSHFKQDEPLDILEAGVKYGASLSSWKEYFPNSRVTGVDIVDQRIGRHKRDDVEFIKCGIKDYKPDRKFDIIVEDGNHSNYDALWAGTHLVEYLKPGGLLVIEDIQEGFMIPFLLWGKLNGPYVVNVVDMRRLTEKHGDFVVIIHKLVTHLDEK